MVAPATLVRVSGRIWQDAETGHYNAEIDGWNQSACAPNLEQLIAMTAELVAGHLVVASQLGVLERELEKVGARAGSTKQFLVHFTPKLDLPLPTDQTAIVGERTVLLAA